MNSYRVATAVLIMLYHLLYSSQALRYNNKIINILKLQNYYSKFSKSNNNRIRTDVLYYMKHSSSNDERIPKFEKIPINITSDEEELFSILSAMVETYCLNTTVRIAGGWVRDKLLGVANKYDIDIALDNMSGKDFANHFNNYVTDNGMNIIKFGIVQQNPDKSKHLETVAGRFGNMSIDFVNLRTEAYSEVSRIPTIEIGAPVEDACRRDLTINSLFYNLHTRNIEDYTGTGIEDLKMGLVRTPLPALITLTDDPLRALRSIRFACRFGFHIAEELATACKDCTVHKSLEMKVSKERIHQELQLMFRQPHAPRAVLLLQEFDIMRSILALPTSQISRLVTDQYSNYIGAASKDHSRAFSEGVIVTKVIDYAGNQYSLPLQRKGTAMVTEALPESVRNDLSDHFHDIGIACLLSSHYLRNFINRECYRSDGRDSNSNNIKCMRHFSDQNPFDSGIDNCNSSLKQLEAITSSSEQWKLFIFANLCIAGEGYVCSIDSPKRNSNNSNNNKLFPLSEHLLRAQLKSITNKDTALVGQLQRSSTDFMRLLQLCLDYRSDTQSDSTNNSTYKSQSVLYRDNNEEIVNYGDDQSNRLGASEHYGPLSRLLLGTYIREAGEHSILAIYIASSRLLLDRVLRRIAQSMELDSEGTTLGLASLLSSEKTSLISAVVRALSSTVSVVKPIDSASADNVYNNNVNTISAELSAMINTIYSEESVIVEDSLGVLLSAIDHLNLNTTYNDKPPIAGDQLKHHFKNVKPPSVIGEMITTQLQWQLCNPSGSEDELLLFLQSNYQQYI